jgi:hypothetical protein
MLGAARRDGGEDAAFPDGKPKTATVKNSRNGKKKAGDRRRIALFDFDIMF